MKSHRPWSSLLSLFLICAVQLLCSQPSPAADGPGLPKNTYASSELFKVIGRLNPPFRYSNAVAMASMHRGYLMTSSRGPGGFCFWNVSNPRTPVLVTQVNINQLLEPHQYGYGRINGKDYLFLAGKFDENGTDVVRFEAYDVTDPTAVVRVSRILLPNNMGGYHDGVRGWSVQAPYVYVGGTVHGIYVIDYSNPASPVLVKQFSTSQLGGFSIGNVTAIGNTLILIGNLTEGYSTVDISNPTQPVVIGKVGIVGSTKNYSGFANGNTIFGAGAGRNFNFYDYTNPSNITFLSEKTVEYNPGYGTFQDGFLHAGATGYYTKMDVRNRTAPVIVGKGFTGFEASGDTDDAMVLGNLVCLGDDTDNGGFLMPHQSAPDNTGPSVTQVVPANNAVNQKLTSRIGLSFSDVLDLRSLTSSTFIVRKIGGTALAGSYSINTDASANFWPAAPLEANTTYEIVIPAGGIKDVSGNGVPTAFTSKFSTGSTIGNPLTVTMTENPPKLVNTSVSFSASVTGTGTIQYSWDFGDGSAPTAYSATSTASRIFTSPGHFVVTVRVKNATEQASDSYKQAIYIQPTATSPTRSSTIILDGSRNRVWNVNSDSDTITAIDTATQLKAMEVNTGKNPRTLALAPDGSIWVANQMDATISVIDGLNGTLLKTIALPRASRPYGIAFAPNGSAAYVTLQATGKLVKCDPTTRTVVSSLDVVANPRGIAISHDSSRIFVSRFISAAGQAEVVEIAASSFSKVRTIPLAFEQAPDSELNGRGIPNYLSSLTISPDGQEIWIPSKKDNTARGTFRDGNQLTFENTVRTIVSKINLTSNAEDLTKRLDINNADLAAAVQFSKLGDYVFVAAQGVNRVEIYDRYSGTQPFTSIQHVGLAPQGMVLSADGTKLYVQNFMSRTVSIYDVSNIVNSTGTQFSKIKDLNVVATEKLAANVLKGKQIFYNAEDTRMGMDGYISCATCHLDGQSDERVWDFTHRGEGLRNTILLLGRSGTGHGRVHWTANFDEIQDFEHDIRSDFKGRGFMEDVDFNTGTRNTPLGMSKMGVSPDLDALAAYVTSLNQVNPSPHRNADGSLTADAVAGKQLFQQLNCAACHSGNDFTDRQFHNVGTIKASSGKASGQTLTGLETPTIKGIWETAPYLHDGSAATLLDVLTTANPGGQHGATSTLTATQLNQLVAYLMQIDEAETVGANPTVQITSPSNGAQLTAGDSITITANASDSDGSINKVEFFSGSSLLGSDLSSPYSLVWNSVAAGNYILTARATDNTLSSGSSQPVNITVGAAFGVKVNFQASTSVTPAGYVADTGAVYGTRGNGHTYGWNADNTANARERNHASSPDDRYDTLNHMQRNGTFTWEISVPNGSYSVKVVCGDPGFTDSVFKVNVEGVLTVSGTPTTSSFWVEGTSTVTVSDGRLTVSNGTGSSNNKICFIDIASAGPAPGNQPPSVNITAPLNGATFAAPASIAIGAAATDTDGTVTKVDFLSGSTVISSDSSSPYATTWSGVAAGNYSLTARATDNGGLTGTSSSVSITVNSSSTSSSASGSLVGSKVAQPTSLSLNTEGTRDWAHWGLNAATDWNHKSGVTAQISNVSKIGTATVNRYTDGTMANSWTGGTPTSSVTSTKAGIYVAGVNNGFQITVPADTTTRTLKVYCGVWKSQGKLEATLSDGSAAAYVDTSHGSTTGSANTSFSLQYKAASAGQSLTVRWTVQTSHDTSGAGTVGWQSATLQ